MKSPLQTSDSDNLPSPSQELIAESIARKAMGSLPILSGRLCDIDPDTIHNHSAMLIEGKVYYYFPHVDLTQIIREMGY